MTALQKASARVGEIIRKARQELERTGYREGLGYDQRPSLVDFLNTLPLSYTEVTQVLRNFDRFCDNL